MGIKTVNGQNAYVIDAPPFVAKTSRGEGYAQYVTNLRWKMWEEAQKSVMANMEFEKMAYQEQMRFLRTQQSSIQKDIAAANRRLIDLDRMEADKAAALSQRNATAQNTQNAQTRSLETSAQGTSSTTTGRTASLPSSARRTRTDVLGDLSSDTQDSFQRVQEAANIAGGAETDPNARIETSASKAMERGNYQLGAGGGVTAGDEAPFKASVVAAEVERAGDAAEAAGNDRGEAEAFAVAAFSADYQNDYRTELQTADPLDGSGGGRVDIPDTTVTRTGKRVPKAAPLEKGKGPDYSKVRAGLLAEKARLEAQLTGLQQPEVPQFDLLERSREKFGTSYGEGGLGLAPRRNREIPRFDEPAALAAAKDLAETGATRAVAQFQAANPDTVITPEQMASLRQQGALSMLQEMGGREVAAKDFLRIPEEVETGAVEGTVAPTVREELPAEPTPEPAAEVDGLFPAADVAEAARRERILPFDPALGAPPVSPDIEGSPSFQEAQLSRKRRLTDFEFLTQMEQLGEGDRAREMLQNESFQRQLADEATRQAAIERAVGPTGEGSPERGGFFERMLPQPVDRTGQSMTSFKGEAPADGQPIPETTVFNPMTGETRPAVSEEEKAEQQAKMTNTTMERRQRYKLSVIKGAEKLASKPKKFERIAKTTLSPEERKSKVAEYVIVVDNLYDTNNRELSTQDAIRASYQELNRVYADEPKVRQQAQEYLLAKDLLQVQIDNPE
tara:strand:+ start:14818 stop:17016 length:2199 start_codon:yes stop_codon:yes gene_type:complete